MHLLAAVLLLALVQPPQGGQPAPPADAPPKPRKVLPGPDTPGPWDRDVLVYRVGADGSPAKVATFERAGVPTVARLADGRLIVAAQHFPEGNAADFDKVAVRFSDDDGRTWSAPKVIEVAGLPETMAFPFDPTLLPLPDGRVRLYFTSRLHGRARPEPLPAIHSAISTDGVKYTFEEGVRFAVEGRVVIDCAAALHKGVFHLFVPDNGSQVMEQPRQPGRNPGRDAQPGPTGDIPPRIGRGYHAVSDDGLAFKRVEDVRIDGRRRWLGNAWSDGQRTWFVGTKEPDRQRPVPPTPGGPAGGASVWVASSEDGAAWEISDTPPKVDGGDPGMVPAKDGGFIVVITGGPRPGTPSASQGPNRRPARP